MSYYDKRNILPESSLDIVRPEVWSSTKIVNIKCKYTWKIQDFKSACSITGTILKSPMFSATNDSNWFLEFQSKKRDSSPHYFYSSLYLKPNNYSEIYQSGIIAAELKCCILESSGEESKIGQRKKVFPINVNDKTTHGFDCFIKYEDLLKEEQKLLPKNKMTLKCEVTFVKQENIVEVESTFKINEIKTNSMEDFRRLFLKQDHSDVTIYVNDKTYPAHKSILAARSSIFEIMLKYNTKQNKPNCIDIVDVDENVFLEVLRFIYTDEVQNLEMMAFELLPVAERYYLEKLKTMCEQALCEKISENTVVKILIAADRYNMPNLKNRVINFIKTSSIDVASLKGLEDWSVLISRPLLMKDVLENIEQ